MCIKKNETKSDVVFSTLHNVGTTSVSGVETTLHNVHTTFCFKNKKQSGTSFQARSFVELFDEKFSYEMLRKLGKFHYQTVLIFQVIQ